MNPINYGQPVNWSHPLNEGLSSWWLTLPNWRGGFTLRDLCQRNHGTLTNMEGTDWQLVDGGFGKLVFGGTNEYVATTLSFNSLSKFTVSAVIRRNAAGAFVYIASTDNGDQMQIGFFSDGNLYVTPSAASGFMSLASNVATALHLVYSFDGSGGTAAARNRVWLNGIEQAVAGTVAATGTYALSGTLDIGRRVAGGGTYTVGDIRDVRVYRNRAIGHLGLAPALYYEYKRCYPGVLNRLRELRAAEAVAAASGGGVIGGGIGFQNLVACQQEG